MRRGAKHPVHVSLPLPAAALMADVYSDHKDEDGFLYITYSGENTFGGLSALEGPSAFSLEA